MCQNVSPPHKKPIVLCILDGWGSRKNKLYNAPRCAQTPTFDHLLQTYPNSYLTAFGHAVGLPEGQIGNSEVGHMHMGAGRVIEQNLLRINRACKTDSFTENLAFVNFVKKLKGSNGDAHMVGLVSDGGVHGHRHHVAAMANALQKYDINVHIHAITDGRDSAQKSAQCHLRYLTNNTSAPIRTIVGRYWAMDRDKNWDRTRCAYDAMVFAKGKHVPTNIQTANIQDVITKCYAKGIVDEFFPPYVLGKYSGFKRGDGVFFLNFRSDRTRQLATAMIDPRFTIFNTRTEKPFALSMTPYSDALGRIMDVLFPTDKIHNTLGKIISDAGLTQLRAAETEKYPHVTFFFSGGHERPFVGERRLLVPSPKIATYDLKPEMSAFSLTKNLLTHMENSPVDVIILNYANPDMVGHTGDLKATVKSCEVVDQCLSQIWHHIQSRRGVLIVTADHGNCETMFDIERKIPHTAHTTNPVHFILCGAGDVRLQRGALTDIAPTILHLLNLSKPTEMTGKNLIEIP